MQLKHSIFSPANKAMYSVELHWTIHSVAAFEFGLICIDPD